MKVSLLIILNKIISKILKLFGKNASVFPASIVLPFQKNILDKIKLPKTVIGVTGSSGKGSTTNMAAHVLKNSGKKVVWNESGSNLKNGIITLILNNTSVFSKKLQGDVLLLELDESYIDKIFKKGMLTHLVVTNVTRDQPPRNYYPEHLLDKIIKSIDKSTHVILNADDVLVNRFKLKHKGKITSYGLNKTKYSKETNSQLSIDGAYCPICSKKLIYKYYYYGHLGNYYCNNCDYKRKIDILGTNINLEKKYLEVDEHKLKLSNNGIFTVYNTLAAYSLVKILGVNKKDILYAFNKKPSVSKKMQKLKLDNRDIVMIESKNENNISYLLSLYFLNQVKEPKSIIIGFDNVSRRYHHNDLSWLYDIDFSELDINTVDRIFCIGRFRFDVAKRLINSGISKDKLILTNDIDNILDLIKDNSKGKIFTMLGFEMTDILKKLITEKMMKNEN